MSIPSGGTVLGTAKVADARQVMDAILADLQGLGALAGGLAGANLLVNGGMRVWQRPTNPAVTNGQFAADRWSLALAGGSALSVDNGLTIAAPARCDRYLTLAYTHAGGGHGDVEQLVELWPLLKGEAVGFSAWLWADTPGMARLLVNDGIAGVFGAYHPGDSTWRRQDVTATLSPAASTLKVAAYLDTASGTARFSGAMLALGSQAVDYAPRHPRDEQALCERYYEVHGGSNGYPYVRGWSGAGAGDLWTVAVPFRARKGGPPTVTKAGTWGVNNCGQPTIPASNQDGYELQIASLGTGYFDAAPNSADDTITAEWNAA